MKLKQNKKNSYSSAAAVGVDVGESATVERLLHVGVSGLRLVPPDLQQLVLRTAGRQSACEEIIGGKNCGRRHQKKEEATLGPQLIRLRLD